MGQHKKSIFSRLTHIVSSILFCIVCVTIFTAISLPLFAQTAEVKKVGVFYKNNPSTLAGMYCDYAPTPATTQTVCTKGKTSGVLTSVIEASAGQASIIDGGIQWIYSGLLLL